MKIFGLVGKNIDYSFSREYFSKKFKREKISAVYRNFDLETIEDFHDLKNGREILGGLNVTIPYKQQIIPYLDAMDREAAAIGAVNTIKFGPNGLTGYNTDHFGFRESLAPLLLPHHKTALILGTGGASMAVAYALRDLGLSYRFVSRTAGEGAFTYEDLGPEVLEAHPIIINTTPLGTYPNVTAMPSLPVEHLTNAHLVYDLIYNPPVTRLMREAALKGATVINGRQMLELQAEKAWAIWNEM